MFLQFFIIEAVTCLKLTIGGPIMDVSLFEIIGPKMMGPSSSATAGMVQLGATCHKFLTGPISSIDLRFVPSMEQS